MSYGHTNMTYKVFVFKSILLLRIYQKYSKPLKHQIIEGSVVWEIHGDKFNPVHSSQSDRETEVFRPGFEGNTVYSYLAGLLVYFSLVLGWEGPLFEQ